MKCIFCFLLFFTTTVAFSQYKIEVNSGNHSHIISADYDREHNELIALDELGFMVTWDLGNYSIINKFQLPPENLFAGTKKQFVGRYDVKAYDSIITVTYPENLYQTQNGERIVDFYHRRTGAFIMQTPFAKMSSVAFSKDGSMFIAMANTIKENYIARFTDAVLTKTDLRNKSISVDLDEVPTCIELNENKKQLAIAYRTGKVEIRDITTLNLLTSFNSLQHELEKKIVQLLFIPNSDNIAFVAEHSGDVMIHDTRSGKLVDSMHMEQSEFRLSASPSGKFLSALWTNFYYVFLHDLQKKTTEKIIIGGLSVFLDDIFFISDDMMIGAGRNQLSSGAIKTNGIGNVGAWLGLIDIKNDNVSANLNVATASAWIDQYGTQMQKSSSLGTVLHGFSDEFAYTDPSSLTIRSGKLTDLRARFNDYLDATGYHDIYLSALQKSNSNSASDLTTPKIAATVYNVRSSLFGKESDSFFLAYYNFQTDSFINATRLFIPADTAYYYDLKGVIHQTGTSFFLHTYLNDKKRKATELVVFNSQGKKIFSDSIVDSYSNKTISISPDLNYFAYQPRPGKLVIRSLKDLSIRQTINTGFGLYGYAPNGYALPQFCKSDPSVIFHQAYKLVNNNNWFCLLSTNLNSKKTDTVVSFAIHPINYEIDSSGKQIAMLYNYDFTDSVFSNSSAVEKAMAQGFKTLFQPSVLLYDVAAKDFRSSIHTGKAGISAASLSNNWITVLQNDGQLLYFNTQNKNAKIAQVLNGNAQALVADSFYYANKDVLSLIRFKTNQRSFAAIQADVFLNRPHDILQAFRPLNKTLIKPYQLAYTKRLEQQQLTNQNLSSLLKEDETVKLTGAAQTFISTDKSEISLPFFINSTKTNITGLRVMINGQPIFGRKGLNTKKVLTEKKVSVQLNQGENYITILAETASGKQLDPVKYYYYYQPKIYKAPKLYFFSAGVSDYKDTVYSLRYAAKDANDILQAFKSKVADTIISQVLVNKDVTRENINAWGKQIAQAGINDIVILYFAGHGLLDTKNNFYYAVHNMDFQQPEKNGLSYEAILDLLDKSPSRKKILMLDACHSGAFDRSVGKQVIAGSTTTANVVNNEKRGLSIKGAKETISESQAFILMNQVFSDFSSDIGIDVIAASLGNSYALEKANLQNGLFTYAMIRAVALGMAAGKADETQSITMEQVKQYVQQEVKRLSNGEQVPSIRSSNAQSASIEFVYSWNNYSASFKEFLEKYK
jgi:hypothetical protein